MQLIRGEDQGAYVHEDQQCEEQRRKPQAMSNGAVVG